MKTKRMLIFLLCAAALLALCAVLYILFTALGGEESLVGARFVLNSPSLPYSV